MIASQGSEFSAPPRRGGSRLAERAAGTSLEPRSRTGWRKRSCVRRLGGERDPGRLNAVAVAAAFSEPVERLLILK